MGKRIIGAEIKIIGLEKAIKNEKELTEELKKQQQVLKAMNFDDVGYNEQVGVVAKLEGNLKLLNNNIKEQRKEFEKSKQTIGEFQKLSNSLKKTEKNYRDLAAAGKENTDEAKTLKDEITEISSEIKRIKDSTKTTKVLDAYQKLNVELKETERAYKNLVAAGDENSERAIQLKRRYDELKVSVQKVNSSINPKKTLTAYQKLTQELSNQKKKYKDLAAAGKANSKEAIQLLKTINKIDSQLKDIDGKVGEHFRKVGQYENAVGTALSSFGGVGDLLGAFKGGGIAAGVGIAVDLLVEGFQEVNAIVKETKTELKQVSNVMEGTADEIENARAKTAALTTTFGTEFNETLNASSKITRLYGQDFETTFNQIAIGLDKVNNKDGFLDSATTELEKLKRAGLDSNQAISFLVKATNENIGAPAVDGIANAVNNLSEKTKASQEALELAFGKDGANSVMEKFKDDQIGAILEISAKTEELGLTAQGTQLIFADVFSAPAEDFSDFFSTLKEGDFALSELEGSLGSYESQQIKVLQANLRLEEAQGRLTETLKGGSDGFQLAGVNIKTYLIESLNDLLIAFKPVLDAFVRLGGKISELFKTLFKGKETISETGKETSILSTMFQGLAGFIEYVVDVFSVTIDLFVRGYKEIPILSKAVNFVRDVFIGFYETLAQLPALFKGVMAAAKQVGINIKAFFEDLVLQVEIVKKKIEKFNPFESDKDAIRKEIAFLQEQRKELSENAKSMGEAFREAYQNAISEKELKIDPPKTTPINKPLKELDKNTQSWTTSNKEAAKSLNKLEKEANKAAKGSITYLRDVIADLKKELLASNDESFIQQKTKELLEFEKQLEKAEERLEKSRLINPDAEKVETLETKKTDDLDPIQSDALLRIGQEIDLQDTLTEISNEGERNRLEARTSHLSDWMEENRQTVENIGGVVQGLSDLNNAILDNQLAKAGENEEKRKAIQVRAAKRAKVLGIAETLVNTFQSAGEALKDFPFPVNLVIAGINTAAGLLRVNAIKNTPIPEFAFGGKIKSLSGQRISLLPNVPTQQSGDNILALVKKNEVVLNEEQQDLLGGNETFRKIGVPGFAQGGLVGHSFKPHIEVKNDNLLIVDYIKATNNRIDNLTVIADPSAILNAALDRKNIIKTKKL